MLKLLVFRYCSSVDSELCYNGMRNTLKSTEVLSCALCNISQIVSLEQIGAIKPTMASYTYISCDIVHTFVPA